MQLLKLSFFYVSSIATTSPLAPYSCGFWGVNLAHAEPAVRSVVVSRVRY
jgi:hypothetical protein